MAKGYFFTLVLLFITLLLGNHTISNSLDEAEHIDEPHSEPEVIDIREEIISTFRSQIGVRQTGNNTGPEIDQYLASVGLGPGYAWCGAFAAWGYVQHNIPIPNGAAWTPNWFTVNLTNNPKIADVGGIYFSSLNRIAHIVVFEENWKDTRNTITTIEGNANDTGDRVGDGVYRKYRSKKQIHKSANWINN